MELLIQILLIIAGGLLVLSVVLTRMYNEAKKEYEELKEELEKKIDHWSK